MCMYKHVHEEDEIDGYFVTARRKLNNKRRKMCAVCICVCVYMMMMMMMM